MDNTDNINFEKLKILNSKIGEYIPIEIFEPDKTIRCDKYPYVTHIKIDKYTYLKPDGLTITRTITNKKMRGKKYCIDRRYKMKKFGQALRGNDGVTTIGAEVFIEPPKSIVNKKFKFKSNSKKISFSSARKIFKPNISSIDKFKKFEDFNEPSGIGFSKNTYVPKSIKLKLKENEGIEKFTIVIKNIPCDYNIRDIERALKKMFSSYGEVERLKILSNKTDHMLSRDIGFLDFVYPKDAIALLKSNERFQLYQCILNLEKSQKKN